MERCQSWAHWNHFFDMHLRLSGAYSLVSTSWVFSGLTVGSGRSLKAGYSCFLPEFPQGSLGHLWWSDMVAAAYHDFDILSLLMWQAQREDGIKVYFHATNYQMLLLWVTQRGAYNLGSHSILTKEQRVCISVARWEEKNFGFQRQKIEGRQIHKLANGRRELVSVDWALLPLLGW